MERSKYDDEIWQNSEARCIYIYVLSMFWWTFEKKEWKIKSTNNNISMHNKFWVVSEK